MGHTHIRAGLLAIAGLLAAGKAIAEPHIQPTPEYENVPTAEPDIWLRRLVGKFTFDGMIQKRPCEEDPENCSGIKGKGECVAIGTGPGVQCILNVTWLYSLLPFLDPGMMLFGLDPMNSSISFQMVIDTSLAHWGAAKIKGNLATFRMSWQCPIGAGEGCSRGIRIEAKPDSNVVYMWILDEIVIAMHRIAPAESD